MGTGYWRLSARVCSGCLLVEKAKRRSKKKLNEDEQDKTGAAKHQNVFETAQSGSFLSGLRMPVRCEILGSKQISDIGRE